MSITTKINRDEILALVDLMSPTEEEIERWQDEDEKARVRAEYDYYEPRKMTILVPVEVEYHDATDVVYGFTPPTLDDVQNAFNKKDGCVWDCDNGVLEDEFGTTGLCPFHKEGR
jgi:hypothetical protein